MADASEAVIGMIPMVVGLSIIDRMLPPRQAAQRPRKRISLTERKIALRR